MFEHLRSDLTAQLSVAHTATSQASAALDQATVAVSTATTSLQAATQTLAQTQATAANAAAAEAAAQAIVTQRQQARDAAQAALRNAQDILAAIEDQYDPNGKHGGQPPPGWAARVAAARQRVTAAQAALNATVQPLQQAVQQLQTASAAATAANATRDAAQRQRDSAAATLTTAQQQIAPRTAARDSAIQVETAIGAQLAALDVRAARILAEPLNREDLQRAADAELALLLVLRRQRRALYLTRFGASNDRATALLAQDTVVDRLPALAQVIRAWPDAGRYAQVPTVLSAIDAMVSASHAQRQQPPQHRADDLIGIQNMLSTQLATLSSVAQQTASEQAAAAAALTKAAAALGDWESAP